MSNRKTYMFYLFKQSIIATIKSRAQRTARFIDTKPLISLGVVIGLLFIAILVGSITRRPVAQEKSYVKEPHEVSVFTIGEAPRVQFDAEIEKSGVITITAQTAGIVQAINVMDGQDVWAGTNLVSLSTTYQGGSVFSLQRQLAQAQFDSVTNTYELQKNTIIRQKELAKESANNADMLREIQRAVNAQTEQALHLNDEILRTLEQQLSVLTNPDDILVKKQIVFQYQSANLQLSTALRNGQYAAGDESTPANIAVINQDVVLSQLELAEKALDLTKETAGISLRIAQVQEGLMYPGTPFNARIEKVHARIGQSVLPGTPLVTISGRTDSITATVYVPKSIADSLSPIETSVISFDDVSMSAVPLYVSREAVRGQLYAITFTVPSEYATRLTDHEIVRVALPIGARDTSASMPFIPLESVYQSDTTAYTYLYIDGNVVSREIIVGDVKGRFIEAKDGLNSGDQVITDRTVIAGDLVFTAQ